MKKILLTFIFLFGLNVTAQTTIFQDSFESYTDFAITGVGAWTLTDVDLRPTYGITGVTFANSTVAKSFQVFNSTTTSPSMAVPSTISDWTAKSGSKHMVCFASVPNTTVLANNDWLISPQITLGTTNVLKFWAKACDGGFSAEKFQVYISSTGTAVSNFTTQLTTGVVVTPSITWIEYTYTIPITFNNLPINIGIKCTSNEQFGFAIDDFKVTGILPCPAPTAGVVTVDPFMTAATLTWTSGGAASSSEVLYQIAGAGVPSNIPGTGTVVTGSSYTTTTPLTMNTDYEFYVRDICSSVSLFSFWSGPYLFNTFQEPSCATINAPVDMATNVPVSIFHDSIWSSHTNVTLSWSAPTTGGVITGYNIYWGTSASSMTLLNSSPIVGTTEDINYGNYGTPVNYNTTYFWKIVPVNNGLEATSCTTQSFTTTSAPAFCLNGVSWPIGVYTPTTCDGITVNNIITNGWAGEYSDVAVTAGQTYKFQSSIPNDNITISTDDGLTAAAFGPTPLIWTATSAGTIRFYTHITGCISEDVDRTRSLICGTVMATASFDVSALNVYPSSVKDILNVSFDKNISSIAIYNILGQEVITKNVDATESRIDMSNLTSGTYLVKVTSENQVKTIKVVKE